MKTLKPLKKQSLRKRHIIAPLILWCLSAGSWGEEPRPAFMQPDVLKAAIAIELTEEQQPVFQSAITTFAQGRMDSLRRLMRANNQTNISRKWRTKTRGLLEDMDETMKAALTDAQWPAYENYRETLKANLRGF